ncbi:MAG: hypothetical protein GY772_24115, partial [bacterium]|nr:hypothetical protein [bacterium]
MALSDTGSDADGACAKATAQDATPAVAGVPTAAKPPAVKGFKAAPPPRSMERPAALAPKERPEGLALPPPLLPSAMAARLPREPQRSPGQEAFRSTSGYGGAPCPSLPPRIGHETRPEGNVDTPAVAGTPSVSLDSEEAAEEAATPPVLTGGGVLGRVAVAPWNSNLPQLASPSAARARAATLMPGVPAVAASAEAPVPFPVLLEGGDLGEAAAEAVAAVEAAPPEGLPVEGLGEAGVTPAVAGPVVARPCPDVAPQGGVQA